MLIPARAGNTDREGKKLTTASAHPRSRGEHKQPALKSVINSGSSPLARGTQVGVLLGLLVQRLIPARAGNTKRNDRFTSR